MLLDMVAAIVVLVVGFVLLVKGADFFVEGSSNVAKKLRVPSIIIGLTIVAMGTSLPETAVSVSASMQGNNAMAISNVTGSNVFNLMAVVGLCAVMSPVSVKSEMIRRDIPISLMAAALLLVLGSVRLELGKGDSIFLLLLFLIYICKMLCTALKARTKKINIYECESDKEKTVSVGRCIVYIAGGVCAIALGGDWVVEGASAIATYFGLSQTLIGLTIVSIGTSLPELVTSVVAARKKEVDMALGNAIGSNIFNIFMVLGIAGVVSPIAVTMENLIDIGVLILFTVFIWIISWKKGRLSRGVGISMLALYVTYMCYICVR